MKIIGLDLGTNSIGWALVEKYQNDNYHLLDKGVRIFREGVKIEKGSEISRAAERTIYRSSRRLKFRRKIRKINVLRVLSRYGYCPNVSENELKNWRNKGKYPENTALIEWQRTHEDNHINPYYFRAVAVEKKLDLTREANRFLLGRAFYHIAQRRGFLSNRLDKSKENEGIVKAQIDEISDAKGERTLGQYFYSLYQRGESIRGRYTDREKHYLEEFDAICSFQQLPEKFCNQLRKAIFFQRPLKSQKGQVGKCPFEKNKTRCPASHPLFEEYRMYQFVNNIKIKTPYDEQFRLLTPEEKDFILPLFYRKKPYFKFEDIAKKLTPKGSRYEKLNRHKDQEGLFLFNYDMDTTVAGNKTISQLQGVFGENWLDEVKKRYVLKNNKSDIEILNDVWHVLFFFTKKDKLKEFARQKLNLDEELAEKFSNIKLSSEYAALSLKAIKKVLPYLKRGLRFSHAVFLAKLADILPANIWQQEESRQVIIDEVISIIDSQNFEKKKCDVLNGIIKIYRDDRATWSENENWQSVLKKDIRKVLPGIYGKSIWETFSFAGKEEKEKEIYGILKRQIDNQRGIPEFLTVKPIDEQIKEFLADNFSVGEKELEKLYHPCAVETYRPVLKKTNNIYLLGSPMIPAIKNPMALRAMHQLRKVLNELLKQGVIDRNTIVNIEMARGLNNANERQGIRRWQREREQQREAYKKQLIKDFQAATGKIIEPTDRDVLKYQLWEEQNHICIYTGKTISVTDFVGDQPKFDIEHTIPRSLSLDNSQSNLTLCDAAFNRKIKRNKIPGQLTNYQEILPRIEHWKQKIDEVRQNIEKAKWRAKINSDNKEAKDRAISDRHYYAQIYKYWKRKYGHFLEKEVPEGFKSSQLIDTGIITKYTRLYLKTLFKSVYTVKGQIVSDFRKIWGIQLAYQKKERSSHIHHCIDAVTIACLSKPVYEELAKAYHNWEGNERIQNSDMPYFKPPWPSFAVDMKKLDQEVLVSHYTPDVLPKQTRKKLRKRGKIVKNKKGEVIYQQGSTIRGALHLETNYGAIKRMVINKKGQKEEKLLYVRRISLDDLKDSDIKNIIDDRIREIVKKGKQEETIVKKEIETVRKKIRDAESKEEKILQQEMERLTERLGKIYVIKNKDGSFTPIKKVRYRVRVSEPLNIKLNRDLSRHDYKHYSHFGNGGNYMLVLYEGKARNGEFKRDFVIVNNLNAGKYFTSMHSGSSEQIQQLVPDVHPKSGLKKVGALKTGTMVIFWEKEPDEIWGLEKKELNKRLYKIIKMGKDGRVAFKYHLEARNDKMLKEDYEKEHGEKAPDSLTSGKSYFNFESPFPKLFLSPLKFNFLIEKRDFLLSPAGRIVKIENHA